MYKVLAIGDKDLCAGFALAGIEARCADKLLAGEVLSWAINSGEYGIVIIDEELRDALDDPTRRLISGRNVPLVIAVPGQMRWRDQEKPVQDEYIAALIRQAVGYQLDIQL